MVVEEEKIAIKDYIVGRGQIWAKEHLSKTQDPHSLCVSQGHWKSSINSVFYSFLDNNAFFQKLSSDIKDPKLNSLHERSLFITSICKRYQVTRLSSKANAGKMCYATIQRCVAPHHTIAVLFTSTDTRENIPKLYFRVKYSEVNNGNEVENDVCRFIRVSPNYSRNLKCQCLKVSCYRRQYILVTGVNKSQLYSFKI